MTRHIDKKLLYFGWALLFGCLSAHADSTRQKLPGIGSVSDYTYSIEKEVELGTHIMHSIANQDAFVDDVLINDYIQQLGIRLASGVFDGKPYDQIFPQFNVINSPLINAFAVPGGRIAIFTGLISVSESESELCSVVAHEIAHVRLRHYAQRLAQSKEDIPVSILGVIAGILASIVNPVAGGSVLISTLAGSAQTQLDHSRQYEYEADVFGYQYLRNAGYDSQDMITFHRRLLRLKTQNQQIEYLLTHPTSTNRISEIASRIRRDGQAAPNQWMAVKLDDHIFHLMKARLLARKNVGRYTSLMRQKSEDIIQSYHQANLLLAQELYDKSIAILHKLLKSDPENAVFLFSLAEAHNLKKEYAKSNEYLTRLLAIYPQMTPALLLQAQNALAEKKPNLVFQSLRKILTTALPYPNDLLRLNYITQAYYQQGNLFDHYLAKAEFEFAKGNYADSFYNMRAAIKNRYIDAEKKSRTQALLDKRIAFVEKK